MRRLVFLLVIGMLMACTETSSGPASSPAASPTPVPTPVPTVVCTLPFLTTNGRSSITAVGFLKLPDDVFRPDPAADSALPPAGVQAIPGPAARQPWWDAKAKRWVPVSLASVSPDGQSYVYMSTDGVHRVNVATGADVLMYRQPQGVVGGQILGYPADVYIVFSSAVKSGHGGVIANPPDKVGVWKIDVAAGTARRILTSDSAGPMAEGALWSTPSSGSTDSLVRTDLGTGQQTIWFTDPGRMMRFYGVDRAGLPIVETYAGGHLELWRVAAPDQAKKFYSLDYTGAPSLFGPEMQGGLFVTDEHGVWFGTSDGLYLYDGAAFRKVATTSGIPAGPCQ
jgi:hypothetical protein